MERWHARGYEARLREALRTDCTQCCGLCCTALYFSKAEGFPEDKPAGRPCTHLQADFRCGVHSALGEKGWHGCLAYDCQGAGPRVTAAYGADPAAGTEALLRVLPLQYMLGYLLEASALARTEEQRTKVEELIVQNQALTRSGQPEIEAYRNRVNAALHGVWQTIQQHLGPQPRLPADLIGKVCSGRSLEGADFSGRLLLAADFRDCALGGANFLGADLRDTRLQGADLADSLFLTQGQVNAAQGNRATWLPAFLQRPRHWV